MSELAESYARWRASPLGRVTEQLELALVLELAGPLDGRRVLDAGTGDGTYALAAAGRGASVVGIDRDPAMLAAARSRATASGARIDFVRTRIEALPLPDASIDVAFAMSTAS